MRRILAAVDFSPVAERVVALASSLAEAYSAELFLIHIAAPEPDFVGYAPGPEGVRRQRARTLRSEHRDLQEQAEALRQRGVDVKALLVEGSTIEKLLEESRRLAVDAIVIGSHGHGAVYRADAVHTDSRKAGKTKVTQDVAGATCAFPVHPFRRSGPERSFLLAV